VKISRFKNKISYSNSRQASRWVDSRSENLKTMRAKIKEIGRKSDFRISA